MPQTKLTDEYWLKLKPILLNAGIYDKPNLRMTVEGMLLQNSNIIAESQLGSTN